MTRLDFEKLLTSHEPRVLGYLLSRRNINKQTAHDLKQNTLLKAIHGFDKGQFKKETEKSAISWLISIAHNVTVDYFRKKNRMHVLEHGGNDYSLEKSMRAHIEVKNIEESIIDAETKGYLLDMINELPKAQREVLYARIFKGMSFKDIAAQQDVSINTALGRMQYALKNLRKSDLYVELC